MPICAIHACNSDASDFLTTYTNSANDKLRRERHITGVYISNAIALTPPVLLIASAR